MDRKLFSLNLLSTFNFKIVEICGMCAGKLEHLHLLAQLTSRVLAA